MASRWPSVLLVSVSLVAGCRTPQKNVSLVPFDDEDSATGHHLRDLSDMGATDRMNLPDFGESEFAATATNVSAANPLVTNVSSTVTGQRPLESTGPEKSDRLNDDPSHSAVSRSRTSQAAAGQESLHLNTAGAATVTACSNATVRLDLPGNRTPPASVTVSQPIHLSLPAWTNSVSRDVTSLDEHVHENLPATASHPICTNLTLLVNSTSNLAGATHSNATARLDIPSRQSSQAVKPTSQPIHLSLPAWTNSASRDIASFVTSTRRNLSATASQSAFTPLTVPVNFDSNRVSALPPVRPVAVPAVGGALSSAPDFLLKPIDLEPLLDGTHDEDWREQQVARQRAEEKARQTERERLETTLQQFLQSNPK